MSKRMAIVVPGHEYVLAAYNGGSPQEIRFIRKEVSASGAFETVTDGTTNEAVLEMLIDRIEHLNAKAPCWENEIVMQKLCECLMWLEKRTLARTIRGVEGTPEP